MPTITDIIDTVATPPLAALQQVLDTNGPFGPGDYKFDHFHTDGAFLLPAGNYSVSTTYGVIAVARGVFPPAAGFSVGWVDPGGLVQSSGEVYHDLLGQVALLHFLPITGMGIITELHDLHRTIEAFLWPALIGSAANVGLYVAPNWSFDMFYLCGL
jgi:hypothetical protein